jgi:hypothetical protein
MIRVKEAEWYPDRYRVGSMMARLVDVGVNSYNMQIATMRMTKLSENYGSGAELARHYNTMWNCLGNHIAKLLANG